MNRIDIVLLLLIINILFPFFSQGQEKRFSFSTEASYSSGIGSIKYTDDVKYEYQGTSYRVLVGGYFHFTKKIISGIKLGLDGYQDPTYNTFPLLLNSKFFLTEESKTIFLYNEVGTSIKFNDQFEKGSIIGVGVGMKFQKRKVAILPSFGFKGQKLTDISTTIYNSNTQASEPFSGDMFLTSLVFSLNLMF